MPLGAVRQAVTDDLFKTLSDELTLACRILADQEIVDAYGQISARLPATEGLFVINRGISPALVMPEDFIVCDLSGRIVRGEGPVNGEWPIHACIYRTRSDVHSVMHSHSRLSRIFSLSSKALRGLLTSSGPEWQEGVPLYRGAGLITTVERGDHLAQVLGGRSAALLRGHGDVIATNSIKRTVLKAITLKQNADVLNEVLAHGGDVALWSEEELAVWAGNQLKGMSAENAAALAARVWDYHVARVDGRLARLLQRV
jgi:ribulose-5-phosphate 4-epimerase/fuculose-1-phosphate aldolase